MRLLVLALVFFLTSHPAARAQEKPAANRPNIVFLLADDMRWDAMGCAGQPDHQDPEPRCPGFGWCAVSEYVRHHLDLCCQSALRSSRGSTNGTHRYTFDTKPITPEHIAISYPVLLRKAGYRTGFVGKFGVERAAWCKPRRCTIPFRRWIAHPTGKSRPMAAKSISPILKPTRRSSSSGEQTRRAVLPFRQLQRPHAEDNDPKQFFWQKEVDDLYRDTKFPLPKTMSDAFFEKQPEFLRKTESRVRFNWRFDEPKKYQEMVAGYYRMISGVDLAIGRIFKALENVGIADNTAIVFHRDNGYFLGERGFADKWYIYEPSDPRTRCRCATLDWQRP